MKAHGVRRWLRSIVAILWKLAAITVAANVVLVLQLRWFTPPTSAFMLQQRMAGVRVHYQWVPLERISPYAALAVISSEDQKFFDHWGFDLKAIADAIEENRSRSNPRGASTISQQVAKNLFLWPGKSYLRKGIESYLTLLMELLWPKERILEVYLNISEMGRGVFGVEAASRRFFGRSAARLSMRQAATLAAVLPSPDHMQADRPSEYVRHRTWQIIQQMNALGGRSFLRAAGMS
ncbi:MAG: monofunctional biosynthetic peptidoglycan transglycosylase [Desulfobacteraceae bacterium]|jgi:monofunctional glycosyltransferase